MPKVLKTPTLSKTPKYKPLTHRKADLNKSLNNSLEPFRRFPYIGTFVSGDQNMINSLKN